MSLPDPRSGAAMPVKPPLVQNAVETPPGNEGEEPFVLLDDAATSEGHASRLYRELLQVDDIEAGQVDELDARLDAGWRAGWHAVVFVPYEFGAPLVKAPALASATANSRGGAVAFRDGKLRILWFRQLDKLCTRDVAAWLDRKREQGAHAGVMRLHSDTDARAFDHAISRIHAWIEAGDTYQVNLTQRLAFDAFGDPIELYASLRKAQPVPYGVLACLPRDNWVLSFSPELFVRHDGKGALMTRPMKGTAPRSGNPQQDAAAAAALAADAKNRAENVMIVDLLRNDLGRIAKPGSVAVPERFQVQPFGGVLQMTSTVTATATEQVTVGALLAALFPCGSITGAPKRRTMEIIAALERSPRGLYTGSIGWIDPPSPAAGAHAVLGPLALSVAIRTLVLGPPGRDALRRGEMGVGGGIVHDSVAAEEYAECGWKARFLTSHDPGFALIETLRVENGRAMRLDAHMARLAASASAFGFPFDAQRIEAMLRERAAALQSSPARLRLTLDKTGTVTLADGPLQTGPAEPVKLILADRPLPDSDPLRRHKTTARAVYDEGWQQAERGGAFDALFFNTRGELLEGGRSSVFVRIDGRWLTPPLSLDILPGVMRDAVLRDGPRYLGEEASEAPVTRQMLQGADRLAVANALRGVMPAVLMTD